MAVFPRTYPIVREGVLQTATVGDRERLLDLRTELELGRRFSAGATPRLVAAIEARLTQVWTASAGSPQEREEALANLEDLQAILRDAMTSVNQQTMAEIDRAFPALRAGMNMSSIQQDSEQFREDVASEVQASEVEDVDALLAAFEQANAEGAAGAEAPTTEAGDAGGPIEDELATLVADEAGECDSASAAVEGVADEVARQLNHADEHLDAIASAFEQAATELDELTAEVAAPAVAAVASPPLKENEAELSASVEADTAQELAALRDWDEQTAKPVAETTDTPATSVVPVEFSSNSTAAPRQEASQAELSESSRPTMTIAVQPSATPASTAVLRQQIQQARTTILSELDDVLAVLERLDRVQEQADRTMRRAEEFHETAMKAQEAAQAFAAAQEQAERARAALDAAEGQAAVARRQWEQARQQSETASRGVQESRG